MAAALKAEVEALTAQLGAKDGGQAALESLAQVAKDQGAAAAPFLVAALPQILEAVGHKSKNVKDAAVAAGQAAMEAVGPYAVDLVLPALLTGLSVKAKPAHKEATCQIITSLAARAPASVGYLLVRLVSPVADLTCDIKKEVKAAAIECMTAICGCTGNKDLEPFLPFATEKWIMKGGKLRIEGESKEDEADQQASGNKEMEEVFDGAGNKIDLKKQAALSDKDKKKKIKDLEKKLKEGKKKKTLTDEECWEIEDQLTELNESLKA